MYSCHLPSAQRTPRQPHSSKVHTGSVAAHGVPSVGHGVGVG